MNKEGSATYIVLFSLLIAAIFCYIFMPDIPYQVKKLHLLGDFGMNAVSSFQDGLGINTISSINGFSTITIQPGNSSSTLQNNVSIKVDYTRPKPEVYLNGEKIWEGDSGKSYVLTSESDSKGVIIKVDGEQIWPKK